MEERHIYESHMGSIYIPGDYDEAYLQTCEMCGDSDNYLGVATTFEEFKKLLELGYTNEYLESVWNGTDCNF